MEYRGASPHLSHLASLNAPPGWNIEGLRPTSVIWRR
jgi:hypothetical protein